MIKLWELSLEDFTEFAKSGKAHQATDNVVPCERECKTPLSLAILNGYPVRDVAFFYAARRGAFEFDNKYIQKQISEGYNPFAVGREELIEDARIEGYV